MEEATSIDGLVAHCQGTRFTGILRMRAREGIGEVWFLSGIADEVHFGVSSADEAMDRMRSATQAMYELVPRLPHPAGGFKRSFPSKGSVATATPVTLMRYCERYVLTCTLEIESSDVLIEAKYELGELVSVETTADDDGITAMLEAKEGTYAFTLPRVELPAGTPVLPPTSLAESMPPPDSLGFRALLDAKPLPSRAGGRPVSDEAAVKRKTVEIARSQKAATAPAKKPAPEIAAKKEEAPPIKPVTTTSPPASPKIETAPPAPKPATTRSVPPRPASPPKPETKEKLEAKPAASADAIKEDTAKPAAAEAPAVEDKPKDEHAAKDDEQAPELVKPAKPRKKRRAKTPPAPPPAKRSMTWVVVPLLCAAALAYLYLTHRI